MVIFTSRSEKNARKTVWRILDTFADRIGNDTWQTVMTEEGLQTVRMLLRRNATKSMAVACFWVRSRRQNELLWIVGNRSRFNEEGIVPVHVTQKKIIHSEWENGWQYLPQMTALLAVAALLHDWGKASDHFQDKLQSGTTKMDPYRHEWISCKLLEAVVRVADAWEDDRKWLRMMADGTLDIQKVEEAVRWEEDAVPQELPPVAAYLTWLILSHHRLPLCRDHRKYSGDAMRSFREMLGQFQADWGYENTKETDSRSDCFRFSRGLLWGAGSFWTKRVRKWTGRLLQEAETLRSLEDTAALRMLLTGARLCLMMGDHYVSSLPAEQPRQWDRDTLWANTAGKSPRQTLEEHMTKVADQALRIAHRLPDFQNRMEQAQDVRFLKQRGPAKFQWQDRAVEAIRAYRKEHEEKTAWFVVNGASTGCGKTIANAKIMQAISGDGQSLRYILAIGLRSLTLQTGDEYRERIGLGADDMAVLIGSSAVRQLHEESRREEKGEEARPAGGVPEELMPEGLDYIDTCDSGEMDFLSVFFDRDDPSAAKNRAFLYKPVLAATIDHMMGAVETTRGGRYMLPFLRLLSSDLVIDEIDDFGKKDLTAIARLVHLAGMLGRSVSLSSATIPPDLAEGMYRAYTAGLSVHNAFFSEPKHCAAVLCDEFRTVVRRMDSTDPESYPAFHRAFMEKRARRLAAQPVRRKGLIISCEAAEEKVQSQEARVSLKKRYFQTIRETAEQMHDRQHIIDRASGKEVSFGLIRMANIQPCVELSLWLRQQPWTEGYEARILTYHSRQTLLLRHEEEQYLDHVLKRKVPYGEPETLSDPVLRRHIDSAAAGKLLFIVVATPVEEVGRDHDFDWAIVEPSSYRSLIQLAGRVLRHRQMMGDITAPNIAVMEYNIRGLLGEERAFCRPGFEEGRYQLATHDLCQLVDLPLLEESIDAVPRILAPEPMDWAHRLVDLEHRTMADFCGKSDSEDDRSGPASLAGWDEEYWWMTALPQRYNRFRESSGDDVRLYAIPGENDVLDFCDYESDKPVRSMYNINNWNKDSTSKDSGLWLRRRYNDLLRERVLSREGSVEAPALRQEARRFGEILLRDVQEGWYYDDQLGLFRTKEMEWLRGDDRGEKGRGTE